MFENFQTTRIDADGCGIHVRYGGSGPPLLLLHGYPHRRAAAPHGDDEIGAETAFDDLQSQGKGIPQQIVGLYVDFFGMDFVIGHGELSVTAVVGPRSIDAE